MQGLHWFAPQLHMWWQAPVVTRLQRLSSTSFVTLPAAAAHRTTLVQILVARERQSHSATAMRTTVFRESMAHRLRTVTMHARATIPHEPARGSSESPSASFASRQQRVGATDLERSIVTRVLRHHRRLEEQVAPFARVLLRRSTPAASESAPSAAPAFRPQPLDQNAGWSTAPAPQGLNIADITDQVVRQLDSRLIATRERFGHV
jgi:hypothetical protein